MLVTLDSITTKITKGTTPTSVGCTFENSGVNFIKSESLGNSRNIDRSKFAFISEQTHEKLKRSQIEKNDILFSMAGMFLGKTGIVTDDLVPANTNQAVAIIRIDTEKANHEYVYYYLNQRSVVQAVNASSAQSAQPNINLKQIGQIEIDLPERKLQDKIVSILSAIDFKIEKNNQINENLQQQMQTIFADWLSANSEYATEMALGDICSKVTDGSHFSPKDDPTSSIPMLSVKDMREFDFDLTSCKHICEDDYDKMVVNDCVPQVNDILVAKDGSYLKEIFICNEQRKLAILSSIAIFRPNTTVIHPEILLAFLKSPRVLQEVRDNYVSGSALPRIVLKDFKKLVLALPDMDTQKLIAPLFTSIREQIAVNVAQNKYLTQLRDALLPKLMSGELNVDNIQL